MSAKGTIFRRFDTHIHTEATAPYMQGDAKLEVYHKHGKDARLEFMAITDHYHYFFQKTRYVQYQRDHLSEHLYSNPQMFLGVEQTILSRSGKIGIRQSGLNVLDFIILSVHWMSYGGRLSQKELHPILKSPQKIVKIINIALDYYINALNNPVIAHLPKIIGHPFNFLLFHVPDLTLLEEPLKKLSEISHRPDVAFEINLDSVPTAPEHELTFQMIINQLNHAHSNVTIASDAHQLKNIGLIDPIIAALNKFGLYPQLLITPHFFERKRVEKDIK